MYEMVQNAYNVTLAGAFMPLLAGAYWKRATTQGALFSIVLGIGTWLAANTVAPDALVPPNLVGFFASIVGMLLGSRWRRSSSRNRWAPHCTATHRMRLIRTAATAPAERSGALTQPACAGSTRRGGKASFEPQRPGCSVADSANL